MELISVEYGEFADLLDGDLPEESQSACLKIQLFIDPSLSYEVSVCQRVADDLALVFSGLGRIDFAESACGEGVQALALLTARLILDLQRDLCEWQAGQFYRCVGTQSEHEYDLYIESIDERVGRFSAELAVTLIRMIMLHEPFDPRLIWIVDLVRHLHRQPRMRLVSRRVAHLLGCSLGSAEWAIQGLERYGYLSATDMRRPRRTQRGCILIVDDSAQIRDLLGRILELLGYDVITAVDGDEGLILLDWTDYKAIFCDLLMPQLEGTVFLQRARSRGVTCPIFAISAYGHRWSTSELLAFGATAYLEKPFSISEIESLLEKYVK
jgi:CheY-like chemotaxis protein